jgi:RAD51-like protein 2
MEVLTIVARSSIGEPKRGPDEIECWDIATKQFSAKEMLLKFNMNCRPIITFSKALDSILGGGIQIGQITEFCGSPGIGKTQVCIQLALNVQIPEIFSGNAGEAILIDTEGSFMAERAASMASELSTHLLRIAKTSEQRRIENFALQKEAAAAMTMERLSQCNLRS